MNVERMTNECANGGVNVNDRPSILQKKSTLRILRGHIHEVLRAGRGGGCIGDFEPLLSRGTEGKGRRERWKQKIIKCKNFNI